MLMLECKEVPVEGYEKVIEAIDEEAGLHAFIAVHSTKMGPSLGGTRIYPYDSRDDALTDALRLSQGMTMKSACAELGLGGGKSVIIADPKTQKTEELLKSFGRAVDSLKGMYICAEDMGTTVDDMDVIATQTQFVAARHVEGSSGDPSPYTAWGCWRGIEAVCQRLWGSPSIANRTVAIQGLGAVGAKLAEILFWHGAKLIVADVNEEVLKDFEMRFDATVVEPGEILGVECDILAPCAMGGILNDQTIPELKCHAVAGSANNQLLDPRHGEDLMDRDILYAPDFVINAGGIINVSIELSPEGYSASRARDKVNWLYDLLINVFNLSEKRGIPTSMAADELALHKLRYGIGRRREAPKA